MNDTVSIEILEEARHRNGVAGDPFYLTMFKWTDEDGSAHSMLAIRFGPHDQRVGVKTAVLDLGLLRDGCITFGVNSWRGDDMEDELQRAGSRPWLEDQRPEDSA